MGVRFNLSAEKRTKIVELSEVGFSQRRIYVEMRCNEVAKGDVIRRLGEMGSNKERPHSGRPTCSTPAQERFMALMACRNCFGIAPLLTEQWTIVGHCPTSCSAMSCGCPLESVMGGYLLGGKPKSGIAIALPDRALWPGASNLATWSPGGSSCGHEPGRLCEHNEPTLPRFSSRKIESNSD